MKRSFEELRCELLQLCQMTVQLADTPGGDPWEMVPKMRPLLEEVAALKTQEAKDLIRQVKDAHHCMLELNLICTKLLQSM